MKLTTKRETCYGGFTGHHTSKIQYSVYLGSRQVANAATKEEAERLAHEYLADAYDNVARNCIARAAVDGTIVVFRQLSDTTAMYEFCRGDGESHGSCMGTMSNGMTTFRTLREYAQSVMTSYNTAVSPVESVV